MLAGRDVLGLAQTGTGKTAAFALPILQRLAAAPRATAPGAPRALDPRADARARRADRRELPRPTARHLPLRSAVIFGGVGQKPQVEALRARRRHPRRHAGPPARSHAAAARPLRRGSRCSSSTRPTACSTWASSTTCSASSRSCRRSGRRCSSPRPCRTRSSSSPADPAPDPVARRGRAAGHHGRARSTSASSSSPRPTSARCSPSLLASTRRSTRALVFTRTKHGANRVAEQLGAAGITRRGDPRQQVAERARSGRSTASATAASACWSRPTSRRAASTSTASRHVVNFDLPERARELRAPHRPHRARRRVGRRDRAVRSVRARRSSPRSRSSRNSACA